MTPSSVPLSPAQPDQASYGPESLALFKTFTRDSYLAAFGVQAAAWDPSRPSKFWFDTTVDVSVPSNVAVYKTIGTSSGAPGVLQLVMPAAEAASVNLPGAVTYPAYVIAPTGTTRVGTGVNPQYLTLQSAAAGLMQQLGGSALYDDGAVGPYPAVYPAAEARRIWTFSLMGNPVNAGMLLAASNAGGVGAPGRWDLSSGFPQWIPASVPTGLDDSQPPQPMPVRDLLPNEELQTGPLGLGGVIVVRTDLAQANAPGFTPDDRKLLQQVYDTVSKLGSGL